MDINKRIGINSVFLIWGCMMMVRGTYAQNAVSNTQQNETPITSSSYGLYFRGYNGAEITLDNNGKQTFGTKELESIPGKRYWNETFAKAQLFLKNNQLLGEFKVKFDQLNQIFYVWLENEQAIKIVDPELVERVVFDGHEQGWQQPVFINNLGKQSHNFSNPTHAYFQELTTGFIGLYKLNKSVVRYQDSLFGTIKKPMFVPHNSYFVFYNGGFKEFKKLTFKNLIKAFPPIEKELQQLHNSRAHVEDEKELIGSIQMLNIELNKKERK